MAATDDEVNLTDLVSVDVLQRMQDAFTQMTGIAAQISDKNGIPVTEGSGFSDFCAKYIKSSEKGRSGCEMCRRIGANTALKTGKVCEYRCHAGLIDFAAPIIIGKKMIGCISGGQVLINKPDEQRIRRRAVELGIDDDALIGALQKIEYKRPEEVHDAADAMYKIANIFSDLAFNSYKRNMQNIELERASHMKSDFLANMSHEIRTPMNAVIGMAEMVLREELSPTVRDYVKQIKSSGQALLTIINDILDFSKIEAGQMDINEIEYEPMSLFNDMVNIIVTRIGNKNLELTMDIPPELPYELYGDNIRIKQILVNIANNAVKFTQEGCVHLKVEFDETDEEDMINLRVSVIDTGIGIKEADKAKVFESFQQVDSKRNRNVEGTGLGLAICKHLLTLMNGSIQVESTYGKGSTFSFILPQKIVQKKPSIEKIKDKVIAAGLIQNEYVAEEMALDMPRLNIEYFRIDSEDEIEELTRRGVTHFFVEQPLLTDKVMDFIKENVMMTGIVIVGYRSMFSYDDIPNIRVIKKPVYSLNIAGIFNGDDIYENFVQTEEDNFDFVAPEAQILVVDDNAINLTVAKGLLEPLNMQIDTALSGKEAVDKVIEKKYDIVFMDHMMPGMDGIETTRVIRRMITGEHGKVPIISLTANAVDGTKEMFLSEGMNDFVAKPIELRVMAAKLRQWLPPEKILKKSRQKDAEVKPSSGEHITIDGLDTEEALRLLGSTELFWSVLKEYYRVIDKKYALISEYEKNEQWPEYTIEVHALKSSSRQIGAMELASVAERMEMAGKARKAELIHETTPGMLEQYFHYKQILAPYFPEEKDNSGGKKITKDQLTGFFAKMREAMENLDMDAMEETSKAMSEFSYEGKQQECFKELKTAVEDIDTEECEAILEKWEKLL